MSDFEVPLGPEFTERLSHQSYAPGPTIDGVFVKHLRKHRSANGALMEYLRIDVSGVEGIPLVPKQVSVSWAAPGRINAFHIHARRVQNEIWTVVQGTLVAWLADMRRDSSTLGVRSSFLLSAEEPVLLYIPSGVAHGYRAGREGAMLLYTADAQFNAKDPNEGRIPWDHFGPEIWEDDRG